MKVDCRISDLIDRKQNGHSNKIRILLESHGFRNMEIKSEGSMMGRDNRRKIDLRDPGYQVIASVSMRQ